MQKLMSNFLFMLLWIAAMIFALVASIISFLLIPFGLETLVIYIWGGTIFDRMTPIMTTIYLFILFSLMGIAVGLLYGAIQKAFLSHKTDQAWRGWTTMSIIGGILGINLTFLLVQWFNYPALTLSVSAAAHVLIIVFACMSFCQISVLQKYVYGASIWILANVVGGLVLISLIRADIFNIATTPLVDVAILILVIGSPGIVTGFAMIWLLNFNWKDNYLEY